jgi:alcohol dehydrogenase class IV
MEIKPFLFGGVPAIEYGPGKIKDLCRYINKFGDRILLVTGRSSLQSSGRLDLITGLLKNGGISASHVMISGEPSPDRVDKVVSAHRQEKIHAIVSIGGGSVIDAGKAISAMLTKEDSVFNYLEGVGRGKVHDGKRFPHIAVPTTAGTGSETTKNAVLSRRGENGFKKSLRHDNFIPDIALLDPELTLECPPDITAASGLDAFTQLLGSYMSPKSSPMTDALALQGLQLVTGSLVPVSTDEPDNVKLRGMMLTGAMLSGITLASAGLGIVHGLASAIGGFFTIPHGVVCGTLVGEAVKTNILSLMESGESDFLARYSRVGSMVSDCSSSDITGCCDALVITLEKWVRSLKIPGLGEYGIEEKDLDKIVNASSNKNNPVELSPGQIRRIVKNRL